MEVAFLVLASLCLNGARPLPGGCSSLAEPSPLKSGEISTIMRILSGSQRVRSCNVEVVLLFSMYHFVERGALSLRAFDSGSPMFCFLVLGA